MPGRTHYFHYRWVPLSCRTSSRTIIHITKIYRHRMDARKYVFDSLRLLYQLHGRRSIERKKSSFRQADSPITGQTVFLSRSCWFRFLLYARWKSRMLRDYGWCRKILILTAGYEIFRRKYSQLILRKNRLYVWRAIQSADTRISQYYDI